MKLRSLIASAILAAIVLGASQGRALEVGEQVVGEAKVGRFTVPLPPGEWVVVSRQVTRNNMNTNIEEVVVGQSDGKRAFAGMLIKAPETFSTGGYVRDSYCDRRDTLYNLTTANYAGSDQDCLIINHYISTAQKQDGPLAKGYEWLLARGIPLPGTWLQSYFRFADQGYFLVVSHLVNPEVAGLPPSPDGSWDGNAWNKVRVAADPERKAYAERFKEWAVAAREELRKSFNRDAAMSLASYPGFPEAVPASIGAASEGSEPAELRLMKIQDLLDKGLITTDEAAQKRQEVLRGM